MEDSICLLMPSGSVFKRIPRSEVTPDQEFYVLRQEQEHWSVEGLGHNFKVVTKPVSSIITFKKVSESAFTYDSHRVES
jgi:hypothetical protein